MISEKIYEKDKERVCVNNKFIYCDSIYKRWKNGFTLLEEKYYSSDKPIKLKKKQKSLKKEGYFIDRFFELQFAPENWLINNNYKLIEDETGYN